MAKLTEEMKQMIATQQCFVATASSDGTPRLGPKRSTRVFDDETLIFTEGTGRGTYNNRKQNQRVAIAVVNREVLDGYRFAGTATVHESGEIYEKVAAASEAAGMPRPKAAVTVKIEEIHTLKPGPTAGTKIG